jgi:hypothetical protein
MNRNFLTISFVAIFSFINLLCNRSLPVLAQENSYATQRRYGSLYVFDYGNNDKRNTENGSSKVTQQVPKSNSEYDSYSDENMDRRQYRIQGGNKNQQMENEDDDGYQNRKRYTTAQTSDYEPVNPSLLQNATNQPDPRNVNEFVAPSKSYDKTSAGSSYDASYSPSETNAYNGSDSKDGTFYPTVSDQAKTNNNATLGMNVNNFIDRFIDNSRALGLQYNVESRPSRKMSTNGKDSAVFCMNKKRLCFTGLWNKGGDNLHSVVMVTTGDGSPKSGKEVLQNVRAFIASVTPGLSVIHIENLMRSMGLLNGEEIGNGFIIKPDGTHIKYEFARSARSGLVVIAQPM